MARSQDMTASRVDAVIELVGLGSAARRKAGGFSLGMRQRLGIAAAMLGDPPVIIMDEPFNGMDPEGIIWMRRLLRSLAAEGRAILVSSHLMSELQDIADQVVVVGRGKVLADASVDELIARASGDQVLAPHAGAGRGGEGAATRRSRGDGHRRQHPQRVRARSRSTSWRSSAKRSVPFSEVTAQRATLEDVYLQLTSGEAEFRAGSDRRGATMTATSTPPHPTTQPRRDGFAPVLGSEWTKFRTVRGWLIGLVVAAALCVAFTFLVANGNHEGGCTGPPPRSGPNSPGPTATSVIPSFRPDRTAKRSPTATSSSTNRSPATAPSPPGSPRSPASSRPIRPTWHPRWRPPDRGWRRGPRRASCSRRAPQQGSPYAAVMATGSHGIRFQYNYTHDQPGLPGRSQTRPRAGCD